MPASEVAVPCVNPVAALDSSHRVETGERPEAGQPPSLAAALGAEAGNLPAQACLHRMQRQIDQYLERRPFLYAVPALI
ncbi:MAG: hypothetical protein ACOC3I_09465 [Verrucomicrobiota bacterium]